MRVPATSSASTTASSARLRIRFICSTSLRSVVACKLTRFPSGGVPPVPSSSHVEFHLRRARGFSFPWKSWCRWAFSGSQRPRWRPVQSCKVTVAQGMEGDGKKEDLTVLGGTSTHRTPKVRSSMELLQSLRQRYLQFLQVVVDVLTDEVSYRDFEDRLRQELDALGRDIVKWVAEACDERLLADAIIGVTPHQRVNDGVKARLVEQAVEQSYRKSGRWTAEEAWHVSAQTVMTALRQTRVPDERKAPI